MKLSQLLEALKPSQYRNLVKGWDKSKYADLFGGKYRIYIPLGEKAKDVKPNSEVESFVKSAGYEIEDYLTGIASKDNGKRKVRIGKLLAKETELKKLFDNDPSRNSSQSEYVVVISRHPYDIAGMTSGRAWEDESCMNLDSGVKREYVPLDIKEGTLVAYLIKNTDKNIESPSARVLIKPFININGSGEIAFGVEKKVYGKPNTEFQKTVVDWVDGINKKKGLDGIFQLNNKLYNDSFRELSVGELSQERKDQMDLIIIQRNPYSIEEIINPSETVQLEAVKQDIDTFRYIKNPTEAVQLEVVKQNGAAIATIIQKGIVPSDTVQLAAMQQDGTAIEYIKNPSEPVQLMAVRRKPFAIYYIKNPSESVQLEVVKQNAKLIKYILSNDIEPPESVQLAVVEKDGFLIQELIKYNITPSEAVQLAAIRQAPEAIGTIDAPSEKVQMEAVKLTIDSFSCAYDYIWNPTEAVTKYYEANK